MTSLTPSVTCYRGGGEVMRRTKLSAQEASRRPWLAPASQSFSGFLHATKSIPMQLVARQTKMSLNHLDCSRQWLKMCLV